MCLLVFVISSHSVVPVLLLVMSPISPCIIWTLVVLIYMTRTVVIIHFMRIVIFCDRAIIVVSLVCVVCTALCFVHLSHVSVVLGSVCGVCWNCVYAEPLYDANRLLLTCTVLLTIWPFRCTCEPKSHNQGWTLRNQHSYDILECHNPWLWHSGLWQTYDKLLVLASQVMTNLWHSLGTRVMTF